MKTVFKKRLVIPKPKLLPKVVEVLHLITEYDKPMWEYDKYREKLDIIQQPLLMREVSKAIVNCLKTHRFSAAGTLLNGLAQQINMVDAFFFKSALIVMENDPSHTPESILSFLRLSRTLRAVCKSEVILESMIYALKKNQINEQHNFKVMLEEKPNPNARIIESYITDPLVVAYMGMFDYIRWCRNKNDVTSAEKAITSFNEAVKLPGQWDIFVLKLVEILMFYGKADEAEEALTTYAENNPEHINSYIYLASFMKQANNISHKLLSCLKVIAKQCPSDIRVLNLVEIERENNPKKSLKWLFLFLDYPVNSGNLKAWKLLSDLLVQVLESQCESHTSAMRSYWVARCDLWPFIHFNAHNMDITDKSSSKVLYHKASVLHVFQSQHPYIQAVIEELQKVSEKLSLKLIKRMNYISELHNRIMTIS